jgi:hypothetical protein
MRQFYAAFSLVLCHGFLSLLRRVLKNAIQIGKNDSPLRFGRPPRCSPQIQHPAYELMNLPSTLFKSAS